MGFEATLGMWALGIVCVAVVVAIFVFKMQYEAQQKNQQKPGANAAGDKK